MHVPITLLCALVLLSCMSSGQPDSGSKILSADPGSTIATRFSPPSGYVRVPAAQGSYGDHLRSLPLKPPGSPITLYNGEQLDASHVAVVDLPIGDEDLHQCADAIIRLRAEYLWQKGDYDQIHFNFTNGMQVDYSEWRKGKRMKVTGNKTSWYPTDLPSTSKESFWEYLELIFMYAGTASLEKELNKKSLAQMQIGDILIHGGHPGHAILIVDMAEHPETGEQVVLAAQSYMPAQEIHLISPGDDMAPWFQVTEEEIIPSWGFGEKNLYGF